MAAWKKVLPVIISVATLGALGGGLAALNSADDDTPDIAPSSTEADATVVLAEDKGKCTFFTPELEPLPNGYAIFIRKGDTIKIVSPRPTEVKWRIDNGWLRDQTATFPVSSPSVNGNVETIIENRGPHTNREPFQSLTCIESSGAPGRSIQF